MSKPQSSGDAARFRSRIELQADHRSQHADRPENIAKLLAPSARNILRRPRIVEALDWHLESGSLWVAAPAGFGKSSAIADYLAVSGRPSIWYRVDPGDTDIASFFHYLGRALPPERRDPPLPRFGAEYADQPLAFARRFFRSLFERLPSGFMLVLDDVHDAAASTFEALLPILVRELPDPSRCICIARTLPPASLSECKLRGDLSVVDQGLLRFSDEEARALLRRHIGDAAATADIAAARGWAAGLVLLGSQQADGECAPADASQSILFDTLAGQFLDTLSDHERKILLEISLLPEITPKLAQIVTGSHAADDLVRILYQRQLLIRVGQREMVFQLHDLLRDLLSFHFSLHFTPDQQAALRLRAAETLADAGRPDDAVELALAAQAWDVSARLIEARAPSLLAQGRRATLLEWCGRFPDERLGGWLCYWLAVASLPDDIAVEDWLVRAWPQFKAAGDLRGLCLAAAQAVLVKTDSWRTHHGLAIWTQRALALLDRIPSDLPFDDALLVHVGMLHAADFAEELDLEVGGRIATAILDLLNSRTRAGDPDLRLLASAAVIEHAGSAAKAELFEQAVDSVRDDIRRDAVSPWVLGLWLVSFGSVSGRYFSYSRRGFPYASAEEALRAAITIGDRESLRSIEFGALYHLQLQLKLRNELGEFGQLVARLCHIADSRNSTQVAVAADCNASLHMMAGRFAEAYQDCERFMGAIEAADEPPIERWPHFITRFQLLLADREPAEAEEWLKGLIGLFDGAMHERTQSCILIARALAAKWNGSPDYPERLGEALALLRRSGWTSILANLPALLSEIVADALEHGFESEFCHQLITGRALAPPPHRPSVWPWPLRLHVLGQFQVELEGAPLKVGAKAPARSLDLLRALAAARNHIVPLADLHDNLWPDADGAQAKAACDQALHRLRKLLGRTDLVTQRDGKLWLEPHLCWVDLDEWEHRLAAQDIEAARDTFDRFPGPLLPHEPDHPLWSHASRRMRRAYADVARKLGKAFPEEGDSIRRRLLMHYPDAETVSA